MDFEQARERVKGLIEAETAEVLTARVLTALYGRRGGYIPDIGEKQVIFYNLLLRGRARSHEQRAKVKETDTALDAPGALGWYWFQNMSKDGALVFIRAGVKHKNIAVCAGALRALGLFGNPTDIPLVEANLHHGNPRIVAEAIRAFARISKDSERIRKYCNDTRFEVQSTANHELAILEGRAERKAQDSHDRFIEGILKSFEDGKADPYHLFLDNRFALWDAAVRWLVKNENEEGRVIESLQNISFLPLLPFRKLAELDYRLYAPYWWQGAYDKPL